MVQVPGTDDWYIAYHRFAIPGGDGTHRETTVDKLVFGADGLIRKVVPTLGSIGPATGGAALPTGTTRSLQSVNYPGRSAVVRLDNLGYLDPVTSSSTTAVKLLQGAHPLGLTDRPAPAGCHRTYRAGLVAALTTRAPRRRRRPMRSIPS